MQDLNTNKSCLLVLAKGLSTTKCIGNFLSQFHPLEGTSSPHLIFLLGFSDADHSLLCSLPLPLPLHSLHSADASSTKRLDIYLKGGLFLVTPKILLLDLLTKRLSPSIVSGLLLNHAHKVSAKKKSAEGFICELLRRGNADVFIKGVSEKPASVAGKGLEAVMRGIEVAEVLLYPRIKRSVRDTLDGEGKGVRVKEVGIQSTKIVKEMQEIMIELM